MTLNRALERMINMNKKFLAVGLGGTIAAFVAGKYTGYNKGVTETVNEYSDIFQSLDNEVTLIRNAYEEVRADQDRMREELKNSYENIKTLRNTKF